MTLKELLTKIDSQELTEWQAYFYLEKEDREAAESRAANMAKVRRR
jgi:hypothetical protein